MRGGRLGEWSSHEGHNGALWCDGASLVCGGVICVPLSDDLPLEARVLLCEGSRGRRLRKS